MRAPFVRWTVAALAASAASGQSRDTPPAFDVATVKANLSPQMASSLTRPGGRLELQNVSLREAIEFAFGIPDGRDDELAGPDWLRTAKFDIVGTCTPQTPRERVLAMLRTLLAERFGLKTHSETRAVKGYALTRVNRRVELATAKGAEENMTWGDGHLQVQAMSMAALANRLSGRIFKLGRPVIDRTGIAGVFDFTLRWTPDGAAAGPDSPPSLFTAIEEQLGLKLESREVEVSVVVVDHMERIPTGN